MKTEKFNPQTQPNENPWNTSDLNIDIDKILANENNDSALRESELLRLAVEMRAIADGKIPRNNELSGFELAMREADEIIEKSRQRDIKNKENREFIADDIINSINKERFMDNIEKIYFEAKYANIMNQEGDDQEQLTTLLNRFESDPKMPKEDLLKGISGISNETIAKLEPRLGVSEEEFMKFSNANQEYAIVRNVWETTRKKGDLRLMHPLELAHKMEQYEHIWRLIGEYNFCFIFQGYYKQFSSRDAFRRLKGLEEDLQTPIFDEQNFLGRIVGNKGNTLYYRNYKKILLKNGTKILQRSPEAFYKREEEIYTDDTMPEAHLLYDEDIDKETDQQWKNIIERTNGDIIRLPSGIRYPSKWLEVDGEVDGDGKDKFSLRNLWPFRKRD